MNAGFRAPTPPDVIDEDDRARILRRLAEFAELPTRPTPRPEPGPFGSVRRPARAAGRPER